MTKRSMMSILIPAVVLMTGCTVGELGKVSGGGSMHSAGGAGKATVAFHGSNCEDSKGNVVTKGTLNFLDHTAIEFEDVGGVNLKGDLSSANLCRTEPNAELIDDDTFLCDCDPGYYQLNVSYDSKNNNAPGSGEAIACVADFGSGKGLHGVVGITVLSGPYEGYGNFGSVAGNVQAHTCPGAKDKE